MYSCCCILLKDGLIPGFYLQGLHDGPVKNWEDFEKYPWPGINEDNFYIHRYICDHLPDGLGFITCHAGGVYEHVSRLMGYENLCYKLHDDPRLVKSVADKLGELFRIYNSYLLEIDGLSVIFQGEDYGFNTQTLMTSANTSSPGIKPMQPCAMKGEYPTTCTAAERSMISWKISSKM